MGGEKLWGTLVKGAFSTGGNAEDVPRTLTVMFPGRYSRKRCQFYVESTDNERRTRPSPLHCSNAIFGTRDKNRLAYHCGIPFLYFARESTQSALSSDNLGV